MLNIGDIINTDDEKGPCKVVDILVSATSGKSAVVLEQKSGEEYIIWSDLIDMISNN